MDIVDECALIGASILAAQKFEFALYGIVSHMSHLPEAQKEKRFRELTPESFLRGDIENLKATLGQLEKAFGERLLISNSELTRFIQDRNTIAHNYWRLTKSNITGSAKLDNPEHFLKEFLERCDKWTTIIKGLLWTLMLAAAEKHNRLHEINFNEQQQSELASYVAHIASREPAQTIP